MTKLYESEEEMNQTVNVISAGTMITGDVVCSGDLRIDGNIKGTVKSKAKIIVGKSGIIDGDITSRAIEIEGNVKSNINVVDLLTLKSTANLVGNICVGKIAIEPGANFAGNCKMQGGPKAEMPTAAPANNPNKAQ